VASSRDPSPSGSLLQLLRSELAQVLPFSRMSPTHLEELIAVAEQAYFAPGEVVLEPGMGPARMLHVIRRGSVASCRNGEGDADRESRVDYVEGDLFPVGAVLAERPVRGTYRASVDTFCLLIPAARVRELAERSPVFADFLGHRAAQLLELSRRSLQAAYASQVHAEHSLEASLATLPPRSVLRCAPQTPIGDALAAMHERHVGSIVVTDTAGAPVGILTRHDIVGRITLPQRPLTDPVAAVMSAPVHTLASGRTLLDAALLMSTHGVRHVPVTESGRVVNVVSERDLFALQRLSLRQIGARLRAAADLAALQALAAEIRRFAGHLLGQGVGARQLTELVSRLNDTLTERLVQLVAERHGCDLGRACWLAFGSEGRSEQTVATDQDNGLMFVSDAPERDRPAWLAFGREVNAGLDACGYPLCKGNVMAGNPACCLSVEEWRQAFAGWIERGTPRDLLAASIYFDLRPLCGAVALPEPMRAEIAARAAAVPRFLKQMAEDALRQPSPLNWRGAIDAVEVDGRPMFDLKLQGTSIFVAAARLYALAHGVRETSTRARLEAVAPKLGATPRESGSWVVAFEYLQMLRLRVQLPAAGEADRAAEAHPNRIDVASLSDIDRHMLREACKVARRLQQRIELDYRR
jgi:CBS domain-containing protein